MTLKISKTTRTIIFEFHNNISVLKSLGRGVLCKACNVLAPGAAAAGGGEGSSIGGVSAGGVSILEMEGLELAVCGKEIAEFLIMLPFVPL
jgi:hypothetical protein